MCEKEHSMNDTTLHSATSSEAKRHVMYKHRVLHHPLVLLFKGMVLLLAFALMLHYLPLAPSINRFAALGLAPLLMGIGYLVHTQRGTIMEKCMTRTKYEHLFHSGHDSLYRGILNQGRKYPSRPMRILRWVYAIAEGFSMASFGAGLAAFAVFLTL